MVTWASQKHKQTDKKKNGVTQGLLSYVWCMRGCQTVPRPSIASRDVTLGRRLRVGNVYEASSSRTVCSVADAQNFWQLTFARFSSPPPTLAPGVAGKKCFFHRVPFNRNVSNFVCVRAVRASSGDDDVTVQEIRTEHLSQIEMFELFSTKGGAHRGGFGMQSGRFLTDFSAYCLWYTREREREVTGW